MIVATILEVVLGDRLVVASQAVGHEHRQNPRGDDDAELIVKAGDRELGGVDDVDVGVAGHAAVEEGADALVELAVLVLAHEQEDRDAGLHELEGAVEEVGRGDVAGALPLHLLEDAHREQDGLAPQGAGADEHGIGGQGVLLGELLGTRLEALAEIKDAPFEDWRNFRRKVLEVAKKELEESEYSEICFDYEPVKSGKGGKVTRIRFFVKKNPKCIHHSDLQRMPSGEEEGEEIAPNVLAAKKTPVNEKLILEVADIFGNEPITIQEIKVLLQVSDNQPDVIRKAFKLSQEQAYINNLVGWLRKCIEEKWYENEKVSKFKGKTLEEAQMTLDLYQEYIEEREKVKKE